MKRVKTIKARVKTVKTVNVPVHQKKVYELPARQKKTFSVRTNLSDGCFLMTYYYRLGAMGEMLKEDVSLATHCERAVYDSHGNMLGSYISRINGSYADRLYDQ